jgi:hypothetical protein
VGKLQQLAGTVATLGAAGGVIAGLLSFDTDTGTLSQIKLGPLVVFDVRRGAARRARRRARRLTREKVAREIMAIVRKPPP